MSITVALKKKWGTPPNIFKSKICEFEFTTIYPNELIHIK